MSAPALPGLGGDGEDDHRRNRAAKHLGEMITRFVSDKPVSEGLIRDVEFMVRAHRLHLWDRHGIAFPVMTVMFVPRINYLQLVRADLDEKGIAAVLKNVTAVYPNVTPADLAGAVKRAFPAYKPGNVIG